MAGCPRTPTPYGSRLPTRSGRTKVSRTAHAESLTLTRCNLLVLPRPRSGKHRPRRSAFPARNARETGSRRPGQTVRMYL